MPRKSKDSRAEARAYAIKLLGYRGRSRKEMRERLLKKGYSDEDITETLEFLDAANLINDRELASELFNFSVEKKTLGKQGIRMFLRKRGIDKGLIEESLSQHTSDMEERSASEFVERKLRVLKKHPADVIKRRLWGMLQRRGISTAVIRKVLNNISK